MFLRFLLKNRNFVKFLRKSHFPPSGPKNDSFSIGFIRGGEKGAKSVFFNFPRALKNLFRGAAELFRAKNGFCKIFVEFVENHLAKPLR